MKKIFLFSSKYCNDCTAMKAFLMQNNIEYINMDITENLLFLKKFLNYRDTSTAFTGVKEKGCIGIPCLVANEGEKFYFQLEAIDLNELR